MVLYINLLEGTVMEKITCYDSFTNRYWFGMDSSPRWPSVTGSSRAQDTGSICSP